MEPRTDEALPRTCRQQPRGDDDRSIIALCHRLIAIEAESIALCEQRLTIEDERRTEPQVAALERRRAGAVRRLKRLGPPKTLDAIRAMARASLATHDHKDGDGAVVAGCEGHWLALAICQYFLRQQSH